MKEDRLGGRRTREVVMEMSRTANNVRKLPSVSKISVSAEERRFWTYVTDSFGSLNDQYTGCVQDDGRNEMLKEPTKRYEARKEIQ